MAKPDRIRVPSDDLVIRLGPSPGEGAADDRPEVRPHEGEWVEIVPRLSVADYRDDEELARLVVEHEAHSDDEDKAALLEVQRRYFDLAGQVLARRLLGWNWTDDAGVPLPQPHGTPAVILALPAEEIGYLLAVSRQNGPAQRKNG